MLKKVKAKAPTKSATIEATLAFIESIVEGDFRDEQLLRDSIRAESKNRGKRNAMACIVGAFARGFRDASSGIPCLEFARNAAAFGGVYLPSVYLLGATSSRRPTTTSEAETLRNALTLV